MGLRTELNVLLFFVTLLGAAIPETPRVAFQLSAQHADILAQCITVFIGPMARHVVEHEGRASSSMDDLAQRLAARLQTTGDRDLFMRAVQGL
jgi:hypothetical protein